MYSRRRAQPREEAAEKGRLLARPTGQPGEIRPGRHPLGLQARRDGFLYVPAHYRADQPAPLAVLLHGAGGEARHGLTLLQQFADRAGLILLAPDSRGGTWDGIQGGFGPDVAFLDRALGEVFARCAVDPRHVAMGGFSDGASYALSLGLANGDLFTHVLAFSPGFMAPPTQRGSPRLFLSHGTEDQVLPIDVCSRPLVKRLKRAGYEVVYREFHGPHTVPPDIARQAVTWFLKGAPESEEENLPFQEGDSPPG